MNAPRHPDLPLSAYIRDPFVRAAFLRAEGDQGEAPVCYGVEQTPKAPKLAGGAVVAPERREMADV